MGGDECGPEDCNDSDENIYPRAFEFCDEVNNDCDEQTDEGCEAVPGLDPPSLLSPIDGTTITVDVVPTVVQLHWQTVTGATGYELSVDGIQVLLNDGNETSYPATLYDDRTHLWQARTRNSSGEYGPWSSFKSFTVELVTGSDPPNLVSPANGATIGVSSVPTQVQLQWQAIAGATGYELLVDGNQVLINDGSQTSYNATLNSGSHSWRARTRNSLGEYGAWSAYKGFTIEVTTGLAPPSLVSPANGATINVSSVPTQVQLQWQVVGGATGYELWVDGNQVLISNGSQTSYSATLNAGSHSWMARTRNSLGEYGYWSSSWGFSIEVTTGLAPPSLVSPANGATINVSSVPTQVQLQWQVVGGATGYELWVDGNQVLISNGSQTSYSATLNAGSHSWMARTRDSLGEYGSWSSSWGFTVEVTTGLAPPSLVSPANGATINVSSVPTQVQLQWQVVSGATGYELWVDGNQVLISNGSQTSYSATLNAGSHSWMARTRNSLGEYGYWSSSWGFTIEVTTGLAPPSLVSPANGATINVSSVPAQVTLQWQTVSGATGYELWVDGNQVLINSGSQTTYNATLNGGSHSWRARTKNSLGQYGSWSSTWGFTIQAVSVLGPPNLVSPANGATINVSSVPAQVTLQWQTVSGATGYELWVDGNQVLINSGSQTTYNATLNSGSHSWRARTKNSLGQYGSWSSTWGFTIQAVSVLGPPNLLSPANGATINVSSVPAQVTLQWQTVSGATGYELWVDGNQVLINSGSQTTYNATLNSGSHSWRARTKNSLGQYGSWSSTWGFTIQAVSVLGPPNLLSPANGATINVSSVPAQVTLQWQTVSGATGYELWVDGNQVLINSGSQTTYNATLNGGSHSWRARTKNSLGQYGSWSSTWGFTIQAVSV